MDSNDAKLDYETILMIRAAWYYYMENYTQQNISTLLGVSRAKVIGLLEKARQTGVIQFRIRQDGDRRIKVEQDLISRFGLKDVFTVPGSDSLANLNESIAQAAAMYIIRRLEEGFAPFLAANLDKNPMKCEYLLPSKVGELLKEGKLTVNVLQSLDKWYGVTYKEDKPEVVKAIQGLKDSGLYPQRLWEEN